MQLRHRFLRTLAGTFLLVASGSLLANAQDASIPMQANTAAPVAYVYISSSPNSTANAVNGYIAYANGTLTRINGSPFAANLVYLATNGKWLFGTAGQYDIASFKIGPNGQLSAGPVVNANAYSPGGGHPIDLTLDHTGQSLYNGMLYMDGTGNNGYQSFNVVEMTGQLDFTGNVRPYNVSVGGALTVLANNQFLYGAACVKGYNDIFGYKRASNGTVTNLNLSTYIPPTHIAGSEYCPYLAAADPYGHVAISLTPLQPYSATGPAQIATYAATATGKLITTSTSTNMPKLKVGTLQAMKMAPSGRLLAVGGSLGLQVIHFNGAAPATNYTGLLTTAEIDQIGWDRANHLYAISRKANKLFVFTVTRTSVSQASDSPHTIAAPNHISVLPK